MSPINVEDWLQNKAAKCPAKDAQALRQAVTLAQLAGEECLQQGLAAADILNDLHVDVDTLSAAIVCNCVLHTDLDFDDVTEHLGVKVSNLIRFTKQMDGISELYESVAHHEHHHPKIDNIRKMLLAMVNDVRAVLIKLAEQLVILRHGKAFSEQKKRRIAGETMSIYAPLANRLGIGDVKWEMEDLAFRYLNPEKYKEISQFINQRRVDREHYVQNIIAELTKMLHQAGVKNMAIAGRVKHIYSIYRKMLRKNVDFGEIYDATALRVMVPTIEDCYTVLSSVHAAWKHVPEEFDDYIMTPKPNGYQSIHTVVIGPDNKNVEIQIRTYKMHEAAELGMAAHWVYKEGPQKSSTYEAKIAWLRQVMDWQQEVTQIEDSVSEVQKIFADRIYVFTPEGDIVDLPQGATVLDFAYQIHSEVGHRCRGAKVDGKIVNLNHGLKTGDAVEILTGKEPRPSRDWINPQLGFLTMSRARAKVHVWFKKQDYTRNIDLGQDLLEKELKRLRLRNINLTDIAHKLDFKTTDELFAALGSGETKIGSVANLLQRDLKQVAEAEIPLRPLPSRKPAAIEIQGVDNLLTNIASCCQPVPGDPIIGYITKGRGISIHRQDCFNILRANKLKPEKLIGVWWGSKEDQGYPINLTIEAYDRKGLIKDITNVLTNANINLVGLNCRVDNKTFMSHINLTIEITSIKLLDQIINKIRQLSDVVEVRR